LQLGAADYLVKGFELEELRQRVANLLKLVTLEKENDVLRRRLTTEGQFGQMIGRSAEMRRAFEMADRVAATDSTVLILGESGTGSISVDVRVISATHRNLQAEIRAGKFREDLFYRLRVVTIELPPLRAHKEDIALLAGGFLQLHGVRLGRTARLKREAMTAIEKYDWPGNVRELKNALERSVVLSRGDEISVEDLPGEVVRGEAIFHKHCGEVMENGSGERDF